MSPTATYEGDFVEWAIRSAEMLRAGEYAALDLEHLAIEIDGVGEWMRREANSGIAKILRSFVMLQSRADHRKRSSWLTTCVMQRQRVNSALRDAPSLRGHLEANLQSLYSQAIRETASLPIDCPFTLDQVLDRKFLPE